MRSTLGLAVLLVTAGCAAFGPSLAAQLDDAKAVEGPVFYLGNSYDGLPLVAVLAGPDDGNLRGADFVYGDCEPVGTDEPSCSPPLDVQNAVCPEGTRIVIYSTSPVRAHRAARHLRPLGGGDAEPYEVRFDHATLCGT